MNKENIVSIEHKQDMEKATNEDLQTNESIEKTLTASTGIMTLVDDERLERIEWLVKDTCHLPGVMAELGVYRGGSARVIMKACPFKTLHLFDTFEGLPEDDESVTGVHKKGEFCSTFQEVIENLREFRLFEMHIGVFPSSTDLIHPDTQFSFVHVDADIYQSTKAAIEYFLPRMVKGGIMVFDDYDWTNCPGVTELVHQYFPADKINKARQQCYIRI